MNNLSSVNTKVKNKTTTIVHVFSFLLLVLSTFSVELTDFIYSDINDQSVDQNAVQTHQFVSKDHTGINDYQQSKVLDLIGLVSRQYESRVLKRENLLPDPQFSHSGNEPALEDGLIGPTRVLFANKRNKKT